MDTSRFWFRPHISRAEGKKLKTKLNNIWHDSFTQAENLVFVYKRNGKIQSLWIFALSSTLAEALVKDKEAGTFVVRDSTSYRGSFGLAMKVDNTATAFPGKSPLPFNHVLECQDRVWTDTGRTTIKQHKRIVAQGFCLKGTRNLLPSFVDLYGHV